MNEWLQEYVRTGSSEAFARIVRAYSDAVYSQSLRQLRDPSLAEEVTQQVFVTLARKARRISNAVVLAGWLFNATRFQCVAVRRAESRRRKHEQLAMQIREQATPGKSETDLQSEAEPLLNNAIAGLHGKDRDAILLRYFHGQSLREVGAAMGVSEDAAKQRISRAVEKLRGWFAGQGLTVPSATILSLLSEAVRPAPSHVAATMVAMHLSKPAGLIWSWVGSKAAAIFLIGTGVVAAATTGVIVIADARQSQAVAANPAPITPAPAAEPISSTPIEGLRNFSSALKKDDAKAIDACLTDDGSDPEMAAVIRAQFHMDAAWCHVQRAASKSFKTHGVPFKSLSLNIFPYLNGGYEAMFDAMLAAPVLPEVKMDGETASIKVNLPKAVFGGTGPNRATTLEHWSGAMLIFRKVQGDWKLDTSGTINMIPQNNLADKKADPLKVDLQLTNMLTDALQDGASQIESGQLGSSAAAGDAMEHSLIDAFQACHVNGMSFLDLPIVGG
jgi:RNA polymerase sigma factor (sigma-70 family)